MSHGKTLAFTLAETEDSREEGWGFSGFLGCQVGNRLCLCGVGGKCGRWETSEEAAAKSRPETLVPVPGV